MCGWKVDRVLSLYVAVSRSYGGSFISNTFAFRLSRDRSTPVSPCRLNRISQWTSTQCRGPTKATQRKTLATLALAGAAHAETVDSCAKPQRPHPGRRPSRDRAARHSRQQLHPMPRSTAHPADAHHQRPKAGADRPSLASARASKWTDTPRAFKRINNTRAMSARASTATGTRRHVHTLRHGPGCWH